MTRRKGRDTAADEFHAASRVLQGPEWEEAAKLLVDKRKSRAGAPSEWLARWRGSCDIAELTPVLPGAPPGCRRTGGRSHVPILRPVVEAVRHLSRPDPEPANATERRHIGAGASGRLFGVVEGPAERRGQPLELADRDRASRRA